MATVGIIGAGITGPAAALALAQQGHDVNVFEQRREDELYSAGILGMTPGNWRTLVRSGVLMASAELDNGFRDYLSGKSERSPFRYISWSDLHRALTRAARAAGANFRFGKRVSSDHLPHEYVLDAGGIFSASRHLASTYTGFEIYRGLSDLNTPEPFMAYRGLGNGYFTVGHTREGAAWALFVARPKPTHLRTQTTAVHPHETYKLPAEYRRMVFATRAMTVSPMSDWAVPSHFHDASFRRFTMGDACGPVRPVTTSGANLAVIAGMSAGTLISGTKREIHQLEQLLLTRRAFDIELGQELEGPEIGGAVEDVLYAQHHQMLFSASER